MASVHIFIMEINVCVSQVLKETNDTLKLL